MVEWRNSMSERFAGGSHVGMLIFSNFYFILPVFIYLSGADLRVRVDDNNYADDDDDDYGYGRRGSMDQEALFTKFQAFLTRASSCRSIFSPSLAAQQPTPSSSLSQSQSTPTKPPKPPLSANPNPPTHKRHIILLEDLPNILHPHTQSQFHAALQALVDSPVVADTSLVPVVIIVSDAGVRGEVVDERLMSDGTAGGRWGKEVVDIRSVLPAGLLGSAYVTQIGYVYTQVFTKGIIYANHLINPRFNPIAPTLLRKALQSLISLHFSNSQYTKHGQPPKDVVDIIVDSSNGDIRSAIMALQFACIVELPRTSAGASGNKKGKGKKGKTGGGEGGSRRVVLEAVTRRESSLALFHLMGKVLYNKR